MESYTVFKYFCYYLSITDLSYFVVVGELGYLFSVKPVRFILATSLWNFTKCPPIEKNAHFVLIVIVSRLLLVVMDV